MSETPLKSQLESRSSVPDLDAGAIRFYALPADVRFQKGALDSPIERTPRGDAKAMAREADVSDRLVKAASRVKRYAADLEPAMLSGELPALAASKLVSARIARADRWRHAVADTFAKHGQDEQARLCRAQAMDKPECLRRWLRSLIAAYCDESADLMHARGLTGAAVLGFDPMEQ